jgi:hypothetical protein
MRQLSLFVLLCVHGVSLLGLMVNLKGFAATDQRGMDEVSTKRAVPQWRNNFVRWLSWECPATGSGPDGRLVRFMRYYVVITSWSMALSVLACLCLFFILNIEPSLPAALPLFIIITIGFNPIVFADLMADWLANESVAGGEQAWKNVFTVAITPLLIGLFAFGVRELWFGRRLSGRGSILLVGVFSTISIWIVKATMVAAA